MRKTNNSWKILPGFAALFSLAVFGLSANVIPALLIRVAGEFKISPEILANICAVQYIGFISATIIGGIIADKIGKKRIFQFACILTITGAGLWAGSYWLPASYCASFIMGMGGGILEGMSSALLTDLFPSRKKFFLNLSQVAYCLGAVSGPFLIGKYLPTGISWRWFFLGLLAMSVILLILFCFAKIPPPEHEDQISIRALNKIIGRWHFICPCIIIFLYVFSETGTVLFMNVYLFKHCKAPENWAIYSISIFWLAMTAGRILCSIIPESMSYEKIIAVLMLSGGLCLACQALNVLWITAVVFFAITGLIFSGTWPLIVGFSASRNPGYSGTVVGITVAAGAIGCILAPPIVSYLFLKISPVLGIAFLSVPLILGGLLVMTIRPVASGQ